MNLPRNRFILLSALWFAGSIYSLLFKAAETAPPPFPHFDKAAHCAAFFAQFWLAARAWLKDGRRPPYLPLAASALILAAATETAQAWFTAHRSGDLLDALADLTGTALALLLARQVYRNRRGM